MDMGWVRWATKELLGQVVLGLIAYWFPVPALIAGGIMSIIITALARFIGLVWPYAILVGIFGLLLGIIATDIIMSNKGRSTLRLRVWQDGFVKRNPSAVFWLMGNQISLFINEYVKFTNISPTPKQIEEAYLCVTANGTELGRERLKLLEHMEILPFKTTTEPIRIQKQMIKDGFPFRQLAGNDYRKAKTEIVMTVSGKVSKTKVDTHYGRPN